MSNRIHLVTALAVASIACLWLFVPGAKGLAADNVWYVAAGNQLVNLQFDAVYIIFSPLYSLIAFAWSKLSINSNMRFTIEVITCFTFSAFTWYSLLAIPRFILTPILSNSGCNVLIKKIFFISLLIFNPVILKYSLPIFSDSYSIIGGTLFTFFHGIEAKSHHLVNRYTINRVDPVSKILLSLHQKPVIYFSLISLLCLLRYGNFFLLCSSLFFYFCTNKRMTSVQTKRNHSKWVRLSFIASSAAMLIAIQSFILSFYKDWSMNLLNSSSGFLIPVRLVQKLLMVFILTIGGREGFRWAINDPMALLNFESLQRQYSLADYNISFQEYLLSLTYLALMLVAFLFSLIGMWRICKRIFWPYILGVTLLLITEVAINVAHQRYFLPFLPSLYFGLFHAIYCKKLDSDIWKSPNGDLPRINQ